jgi:hypothetical protein
MFSGVACLFLVVSWCVGAIVGVEFGLLMLRSRSWRANVRVVRNCEGRPRRQAMGHASRGNHKPNARSSAVPGAGFEPVEAHFTGRAEP